jgi:hypothetical protein
MEERIQARLEQLKSGREEHVRTATLTLEGFNAAIGELEGIAPSRDAAGDRERAGGAGGIRSFA